MSLSRLLLAGCVFCVWYRTLNWEHGYVNRWTFPKSSPETRRLWSWLLQTALTSVPSEPSGHKPEERAEGQNQQRHRRKGEEASSYQTHGSPEGRCRWPSQCLWWSPHWPPVYTLMGSLRTLLPNIETHKIWGKGLCHGSCDVRQFKKQENGESSKTLTVENLIVPWIWHQKLGVHWPVQVGDEARVTLGCDANSSG